VPENLFPLYCCGVFAQGILHLFQQLLKTSISGTNTSLQTSMPFTVVNFFNDCLLQPVLHVNHLLLQFIDIMDPFLSTTALFFEII